MTRVQRRESKGIAIHNEIFLRTAGLAKVGRVLGGPGLGVHGTIGAVGDPVNQDVICVEVVLRKARLASRLVKTGIGL